MKCPHCKTGIFVDEHNTTSTFIGSNEHGNWGLEYIQCPACSEFIIYLIRGLSINFLDENINNPVSIGSILGRNLIYPKGNSHPPCPPEVPSDIAQDYTEACLVLADSPKASAALSRRCLQNFLREVLKVKPSDLNKEIEEAKNQGMMPSYIKDAIDAIRAIGNFAAHPMKSNLTGEILPVEPQEAEWNLEVLEALFDFYLVQPNLLKKKKAALDQKLSDAGKPPTK